MLSTPNRDLQTALHFDRIDYKCAKSVLAEANRRKEPLYTKHALAQVNRARAQLRRTMNEVETRIYGMTRKEYLKRSPRRLCAVAYIPSNMFTDRVRA